MHKISLIFFFIFSLTPQIKASEYEITVLATNTANFGGIGEWSFSALLESEEKKFYLIQVLMKTLFFIMPNF